MKRCATSTSWFFMKAKELAKALVKAAQEETKAKHGPGVHLDVSAWHVRIGRRKYLIRMQVINDVQQ